MIDEVNDKQAIIKQISEMQHSNPKIWALFINQYPDVMTRISNYTIIGAQQLKEILSGFNEYIKDYNAYHNKPQLTMNNPIVQEIDDDEKDDLFD